MNANRYVLRPAITGPCNASPVHRSLGAAASNRPNAAGGVPSGRVLSSRRTKWRCRVRTDGAEPACSLKIAATWAAVRPGTSRFNAVASSSTEAGVRGSALRAEGTRASNPPVRQARIHRSNVSRETRTRSPNGPACSWLASSRTSRPRCRIGKCGSAAGRISAYRNRPTSRARSA